MSDGPKFTRQMKLNEIRREIEMRQRVYPRRVGQKKMRQAEADLAIALMEDIARDYERAINRTEDLKNAD